MVRTIRVLVAEDHPLLRQILGNTLESQDDLTVVGAASNGAEAVDLTRSLHPDVVLMDYEMPEMGGVRATQEITDENPSVAVVGFSGYEDEWVHRIMLDAGAAIVLSKNGETSDLLRAIREHGEISLTANPG